MRIVLGGERVKLIIGLKVLFDQIINYAIYNIDSNKKVNLSVVMSFFSKIIVALCCASTPSAAQACKIIGNFGSGNDSAIFYRTNDGLVTFTADMDVNTDGSPNSYHVNDLGYFDHRGKLNTRIGLNTICNGVSIRKPNGNLLYSGKQCSKLIKEFIRIQDFGWVKPGENFVRFFGIETIGPVRSSSLNERRKRRPCIRGKYFVSQIARQLPNSGRYGNCNANKWLDAESIPAIVVPLTKKIRELGVGLFDVAIIRLKNGKRIGAVVGDTNKFKAGEVTVNAAVRLTGKTRPKTYRDLFKLSIADKTVEYTVFPNTAEMLGNLKNTDDAKIQEVAEKLYQSHKLDKTKALCGFGSNSE